MICSHTVDNISYSNSSENEKSGRYEDYLISNNTRDSFDVFDVPFFGCDFREVYPSILPLIPPESVSFAEFGLDNEIMCEMVCAVICHQINWNFLRRSVFDYTNKNPEWLSPKNLSSIEGSSLLEMIGNYNKKDNIKEIERASILRSLGYWVANYPNPRSIFLDEEGSLRPRSMVFDSFKGCSSFASDPGGKKRNLLLQKLELIPELHGIGRYAKPAIDYHLIRLYLRRGLLYARNKYGEEYISNPDIDRREHTVAAIRDLCSSLLIQISSYTDLSISSVNLIEWSVARSVCDRDLPDCLLERTESQWLKPVFKECPFCHTCKARLNPEGKLLIIKEPSYKGTSY